MEKLLELKEFAIEKAKLNDFDHSGFVFMRFKGHRISARAKTAFKRNSTQTTFRVVWELDGKKISKGKLAEFIQGLDE